MTTTPPESAHPPRPRRHGRPSRPGAGTRLTPLTHHLARVVQSIPGAIIVTVVAIGSVIAITIGVLQVAAPDIPDRQSPVDTTTPAIGAFSHHPVRIKLPTEPDSYLGAYVDGVPRHYAPIESFATSVARPNIALYYSGWGEPFQAGFATSAAYHNVVPLVQIEPGRISLASIAAGNYDHYLEAFATAVASYGAQTGQGVIISFGHEPNGPWYPWGVGHASPAAWIAAWRHIVTVFRQQGADDVTWLWTVNIIARQSGVPSPVPWWPGNSYVTWIGIDGYYYKPSWTFPSLFGPTIKAVRTLALDPILVSETGVAPAAGQPGKIASLFAGVRAYGLLGFVWFDAKRKYDWRLTSPTAIAAFRDGAKAYKRAS
jgi:mannan endo-1,4-beta-mannosidase